MTDIQAIVVQLQEALGLQISCGSIILNMNESKLQSVKTETYRRIDKRLDNAPALRQT